jgi:hypothetical protein
MIDSLLAAVAAGISLGAVLGYRGSRALIVRVGGPHARKPSVIGLTVAGMVGFLVPAILFAVLISKNLRGTFDPSISAAVESGSPGALFGIAAGIALVIGSGLMVAAFASVLCARLIEDFRGSPPDEEPPPKRRGRD